MAGQALDSRHAGSSGGGAAVNSRRGFRSRCGSGQPAEPNAIAARCTDYGRMWRRNAWCVLPLWCLVACAPGLQVRPLAVASGASEVMAAYVDVRTSDGDHVVGLQAGAFQVFEDGSPVDPATSQLRVVDAATVSTYRTLVLVDASGSAVAGAQRDELAKAVAALVTSIARHHEVAVFGFDGGKRLRPVAPFARTAPVSILDALTEGWEIDPRTNLHGAVIEGLQELDRAVSRSDTPFRFGTLVVLTDGSDRARRVALQEVQDAMQASRHRLLTVGIGNQADDATLARLGIDGYVRVDDLRSLVRALRLVAGRVVAPQRGRYLLAYCSQQRTGSTEVRIEVRRGHREGQSTFRAARPVASRQPCDPDETPILDVLNRR